MNATLLNPTVTVIGQTVQNRPIGLHVFEAKNNPDETVDTLFVGVIHGDEGIAGQILGQFMGDLCKAHIQLPPKKTVGIIQVLNQDGLKVGTRVNANKVDLNRNCPTQNWTSDCDSPDYHPGTSAGSEPETQALIQCVKKYQPKKIITVHSPYKVINYDGPAKLLAEAMARKSGYTVTDDIGYATPGSMGTYFGKELGLPIITLELPETGSEPLTQVYNDNKLALLAAVEFDV